MSEHSMPLLGEKFPEMEVHTTHGKMKLPDDMKGKWFMLFSHPGDFTPVCTTEFYAFAKNAPRFEELDTKLIGLSIDQVHAHIKWVEWIEENLDQQIPFPIIADDLGRVAKKLGMISPAKGNTTVRAVFIVDDEGILRLMMYYPQETGRNVEEILRSIKALQVTSKMGRATPHNWPNNELVKDKVIVPPASNRKQAKENMEKYPQGYDWWFRYEDYEE